MYFVALYLILRFASYFALRHTLPLFMLCFALYCASLCASLRFVLYFALLVSIVDSTVDNIQLIVSIFDPCPPPNAMCPVASLAETPRRSVASRGPRPSKIIGCRWRCLLPSSPPGRCVREDRAATFHSISRDWRRNVETPRRIARPWPLLTSVGCRWSDLRGAG